MKKKNRIKGIIQFFFVSALLLLPCPQDTIKNDAKILIIQEHRKTFENWLHLNYENKIFPSIAVAVIKKDRVYYSYFINSDFHKPYGLASITKTFTATGIMILQEKNQIHIDMKVRDIFPNLIMERSEFNSEPVTLKHLITHTSGMPDLRYYKDSEFIDIQGNDPPVKIPKQIYPAGVHYRYSNHGFIILGKVIEKYSRSSLDHFMYKNIFNPLGMTDTKYNKYYTGAYGLNSSIRDMIRYAMFLINEGYSPVTGNRILSGESLKNMTQEPYQPEIFLSSEYCGLGWRAIRVRNSVVTFFHIGGNTGIGAWIQIFPRQKMAVLYLSDPPLYDTRTMDFLFELQSELSRMVSLETGEYFNIQSIIFPQHKTEMNKEFTGKYKNAINDRIIKIYKENIYLRLKDEEGRDYQLYPRSIYIFNGGYEFLTHQFIRDEKTKQIIALARFDGYYKKISDQ